MVMMAKKGDHLFVAQAGLGRNPFSFAENHQSLNGSPP
jgi:hypothetical protein